MKTTWITKAIAEGRICPECKQPVSRKHWAAMNFGARNCWTCRYAHWQVRSPGRGGSVARDNAGREALDAMRGSP